ncbi:STAS domain-containing protein [Planctomycetota bacterium]
MAEKTGVEIVEEGEVAVVAFRSASVSNVEEITAGGEQVGSFIEEKRPARVVFDFSTVKFFSSQVLGLLLDIRSRMQEYNGEIVISGINPQLHRVFKITKLDSVFGFYPDKEAAVRANRTN